MSIVPADTQAREVLDRHRRVWQRKRVLQRIYNEEFFARLLASRKPEGMSIEVGGGPGFLKQLLPSLVTTDLIFCPWLDVVTNAQRLPFRSSRVANILGLDVLHHLAEPMRFLKEAERILVPGGRLILVEPWITPFSYLVYRYLHQEDCDLSARPWEEKDEQRRGTKQAFEGNQALPFLLLGPKGAPRTLAALPKFTIVVLERFCLFAYLLSFGFKPVNFLPEILYPMVSAIERATLPLWRSLAALRVLIVLERRA